MEKIGTHTLVPPVFVIRVANRARRQQDILRRLLHACLRVCVCVRQREREKRADRKIKSEKKETESGLSTVS